MSTSRGVNKKLEKLIGRVIAQHVHADKPHTQIFPAKSHVNNRFTVCLADSQVLLAIEILTIVNKRVLFTDLDDTV